MADLKALQKKIATLLYEQLAQYFNQVQIISYKPSAEGKVTGKFIGDRRSYNFVLANNQLQYLPSTKQKMDSAIAKGVVQCTGSNHPCKGEKGTRCVPDTQSCKQKEASPEGLARIKAISETSKQITALASPKTATKTQESKNNNEPPLDKDISLYDFMKYYSPWRPSGTRGFENVKPRDKRRPTNKPSQSSKTAKPSSEPSKSRPSNNETQPKQLGSGSTKTKQEPKEKPKTNGPYEYLGINPKDFPNEKELYKAAKTAYRNLAAKYHPDKGGDPKLMTELNNVMDRLRAMRRDAKK